MSHAPTAALERRHARRSATRDSTARASLDALVVTSLPNILYLTNFTRQRGDRGPDGRALRVRHRLPVRHRDRRDARARRTSARASSSMIVDGSYDATLADRADALARRRASGSRRRT